MLVLDIETIALPDNERELFKPEFEANRTLKDPEKIKADLANKEARWNEDTALSSLTGKILCVGCWTPQKEFFVIESENNESDVVQSACDLVRHTIQEGQKIVGFCCKSFDLPFLVQRAYRLGVNVPRCLFTGRWWSEEIIDLRDLWACPGNKDMISLDFLAKALGVGAKNLEGKDFANLWLNNRTAAIDYLRNDIELTRQSYIKMQIT